MPLSPFLLTYTQPWLSSQGGRRCRSREALKALLDAASDHWGFEDPVYRFYHQSFKVFSLQRQTETIVQRLSSLLPDCPLHPWFLEIVRQGTGLEFSTSDNNRWTLVTRPIVEAFFHARFFLEDPSGYIVWQCPLCGDHGGIHGWEDTLWNRDGGARPLPTARPWRARRGCDGRK